MNLNFQITARATAITAILAAVAGIFYSSEASTAVIAGGLIALVNFILSSRALKRIITPRAEPSSAKRLAFISYITRYAALVAVLYIAIKSGVPPIFFLVGLSAVAGAIFLSYKNLLKVTA